MIRNRVLINFIIVALLPTLGVSLASLYIGYVNGRQQAFERLQSITALKAQELQSWATELQTTLLLALNDQYDSERISVVLDLARSHQYYAWYNGAVRARLQQLVGQTQKLQSLCLLDTSGAITLCTAPLPNQGDCRDLPIFAKARSAPVLELPLVAPTTASTPAAACPLLASPQADTSNSLASLLVARPIYSEAGSPLGVIVGQAQLTSVMTILNDQTGLGETGNAYLSDERQGRLPPPPTNTNRQLMGSNTTLSLANQSETTGIYQGTSGQRVLGVYRWLPDLQVTLAVEQDLTEAFWAIWLNLLVSVAVALAAIVLAISAALLIARTITRPLVTLAEAATQIAAGDLSHSAPVQRMDEIGTLALAFNRMTAQLSDLINHLEQRVEERTTDLQAANLENARLYERNRDLAVLEERNRLARDLHDSVVQSLYGLSSLAEGWRRKVQSNESAPIEEFFDRSTEISQQALKEMRLLIYQLRPAALARDGLLGALHQRLDAVERRAGIKVRFTAEELIDLPAPLEEALYGVAQEALNNALKHSQANEICVHFDRQDESVILRVKDNGKGFEPDHLPSSGGMGLDNMRQRMATIGGVLTIASSADSGTIITARVKG